MHKISETKVLWFIAASVVAWALVASDGNRLAGKPVAPVQACGAASCD